MNRSHLRFNLALLLTATVTMLLLTPSTSIAQDNTATLSGRVVDVDGKPVADLPISIQPFVIRHGELLRAFRLKNSRQKHTPLHSNRKPMRQGGFPLQASNRVPFNLWHNRPICRMMCRNYLTLFRTTFLPRTARCYPSKLGQSPSTHLILGVESRLALSRVPISKTLRS